MKVKVSQGHENKFHFLLGDLQIWVYGKVQEFRVEAMRQGEGGGVMECCMCLEVSDADSLALVLNDEHGEVARFDACHTVTEDGMRIIAVVARARKEND